MVEAKMVRSIRNIVRWFLDSIVSAVIVGFVGDEGRIYFPVTRQCCKCGTIFLEPRRLRRPRQKLDECVRCQYSLIGNVSGVCPECAWKLTRAQKRFVRERGTGGRTDADE